MKTNSLSKLHPYPGSKSYSAPAALSWLLRSLAALCPLLLGSTALQGQTCGQTPVEAQALSTNRSKVGFYSLCWTNQPVRYYLVRDDYVSGYFRYTNTTFQGDTHRAGDTYVSRTLNYNPDVWDWEDSAHEDGCGNTATGLIAVASFSGELTHYSYVWYATPATSSCSAQLTNLTSIMLDHWVPYGSDGTGIWDNPGCLLDYAASLQGIPDLGNTTNVATCSASNDFSATITEYSYSDQYTSTQLRIAGTNSYILSSEYTTLSLKQKTANDLSQLTDYGETWSSSVQAASKALCPSERVLALQKLRYRFEYETETNTTYEITKRYTVWTNDVVYSTNVVLSILVEGDGKTHTETNQIVPTVEGDAIVFKENGTNFLVGDLALSVAVAVCEVTVKPYDDGCGSCESAEGSVGGPGPSLQDAPVFRSSLGRDTGGKAAGRIQIHAASLSPSLYTPSSLQLLALPERVTVVTNTDGTLRQAGTAQCLTDIQTLTAGSSFKITFFATNALYPGNGNNVIPTAGLIPEVAWTFDNPDAGATNRWRVIEARGFTNSTGASVFITNIIAWSSANQQWELVSGNNLRKETVTTSWDASQTIRTAVRQVLNPTGGAVLAQSTERYELFSWGEGLVERIEGTGSGSRTNTYTYNTSGRLDTITSPEGGSQSFNYDSRGRLSSEITTHGDSGSQTTSYAFADTAGLETYGDNTNLWPRRPRSVTGANSLSFFLAMNTNRTIDVRAATFTTDPFQAGNLCTTNNYYPAGTAEATRLQSVEHPDGTMTFYTYGGDAALVTNVVSSGEPGQYRTNILNGNRAVTVLGSLGEIVRLESYAISGGVAVLVDRKIYSYTDALKRSHWISHLDGTSNLVQYACCGLDLTVDREGTTTQYYNDPLKRQVASRNVSLNITVTNVLDAAGRLLQTIRVGSNGTRITNSSSAYDLAGRLTCSTNALGGITGYSYSYDAAGHAVTTTTYPDGGQRIETYYKDGTLYQVTGSAVFPVQYEAGTGYYTERKLDGAANSETTTTYTDMLGRTTQTSQGGYSSFSYYNEKGQLSKQMDADGVATLFQYDSQGQREFNVIDMDRSDTVDLAGSDRVTRTLSDVITNYSTTVRRTRTYVWPTNEVDNPLLVATSESSVDGLRTWHTVWNGGAGVTNISQTAYPGSGYRYITNTAPNGSRTISQSRHGQLLTVARLNPVGGQLGKTTYSYDSHGRQQTVADARNGTNTFAYNNADLITSVTTPTPGNFQAAQTTTTYYNPMLQATNVVQADGSSIYSAYHTNGLRKLTWGSRTYPVEYSYDHAGRVKTMKTWQDASDANTIATTTWNYDTTRGLLENKRYHDNSGPDYTYTAGGRLASRAWARGVSATYSFNNAGDLEAVTYNDGITSAVTLVYDRMGRQATNSQGDVTITKSYGDAGQMLSEAFIGGGLDGLSLTNGYDHLLRRTNLVLLNAQSVVLARTTNSFDSAGQFATVGDGTVSATYSYLANSPLVEQIAFANNGSTVMTTKRTFDYLNRLTSIQALNAQQTPFNSFAYDYNSANQRTLRREADGAYWRYEYDVLGQVKRGKKYWSDGTPVAGQQFEYGFDDIGNRRQTKAGGDENGLNLRSNSYGANLLNQYTNRSVQGAVDAMGVALATNTVTVNSAATYRKGEYFRKELAVDNSTAPVWLQVNVAAPNETTLIRHEYVPQTPEVFTHDLDGNLTQDGYWNYTWDAENRLTAIERVSAAPDNSKVRIEFKYDPQWRRIQKIVSTWDSGTWSWVAQSTNWFVYDGWNLVGIINSDYSILQSFTWGTDLSGSLQGAGGIGGLLATKVHSGASAGSYFYCHDGNGNVATLVKTDGTVAAQYEFAPFGEVLRGTGPMATANPFRFSTKYQDDETGLLYYGFRYYDPSTGRWNSRDPIDEHGGENLQVFVFNDAVNFLDRLGLQCSSCPKPPPGQAAHTCPAGKLTFRRRPPKIVSVATIKSFPQQSNPPAPAITLPSYTENLKCERCSTATCGWKLVLTVDSTCETFYVDDRRVPTLHYVPSVAAMIHHENDCHCDDWEAAFTAIRDRLAGPHYSSKRDCQNAKKAINFESLLKQEIAPSEAHADPKYGMPPHQNTKAPCYATWSGTF